MRELWGSAAKLILVVVVLGIILNDLSAILSSYWFADDVAKAVAESAANEYRATERDENAALRRAYAVAGQKRAKLTGWQIDEAVLTVKVTLLARRTVFADRVRLFRPYLRASAIASSPIR